MNYRQVVTMNDPVEHPDRVVGKANTEGKAGNPAVQTGTEKAAPTRVMAGKNHHFEVEPAVFKAIPSLVVLIAVVRNIDADKIDRAGIKNLLERGWEAAHRQVSTCPNVQSHPNIQLWRNAFTALKISTKKFVSSVESMAKRTTKAGAKPHSVNPLVDFYNAFSLKYLLPFGGFDLSTDITRDMQLRFSREGDKFAALDSDAAVDVTAGEVAYASGSIVVTRHINWKQSKEGLIGKSSVDVCFMAEILEGYPADQLAEMQKELQAACLELLHVQPEILLVNESCPSVTY